MSGVLEHPPASTIDEDQQTAEEGDQGERQEPDGAAGVVRGRPNAGAGGRRRGGLVGDGEGVGAAVGAAVGEGVGAGVAAGSPQGAEASAGRPTYRAPVSQQAAADWQYYNHRWPSQPELGVFNPGQPVKVTIVAA
jgi:hypothetical protein